MDEHVVFPSNFYILLCGIFVALTMLGAFVSPIDPLSGQPFLYTSKRYKLSKIQQQYEGWLLRLIKLDAEIDTFLSSEKTELMDASFKLESLLQMNQTLADEVKNAHTEFPYQTHLTSLFSLIESYQLVVQSLYQYHLIPTDENLTKTYEMLEIARNQRVIVKDMKWNPIP